MPRTPGTTKLVGTGALLLTVALGWMLVVSPGFSALADARLRIDEARSQNVVLAQQLALLTKQGQELGGTMRTADGLAAKFPPTADLPELFRAVTGAAVDAGIGARGVTTLAPSAPVMSGADPATGLPLNADAEPSLARQTVSVSVTGTFDQTQRLLENLEQMTRAFMITTVSSAVGESRGSFVTTISGVMFVMPALAPPRDPGDDSKVTGD